MTRPTQDARRSGSAWPFPTVLLAALVAAALAGFGCTPDVPADPVPAFLELQFDPSSAPPKSYEPNLLLTNAETQLLDFSAAGIEIPADPLDCPGASGLSVAQCELYWFLEGLDGFPTLTPGRTPVSGPVDVASVTLPGNLWVYEFMRGTSAVTALDVAYDADEGYLTFDPQQGWDINGLYMVAVRGYANGVKDQAGNQAVKSIIYVLLSQDSSLTCGATTADAVDEHCAYYELFSGDARFSSLSPAEMHAAIAATLLQLEQLRQLYKGELPGGLPINMWDVVAEADKANMPAEEVAILWAFRTHTASVVELNPNKGMLPNVTGPREVRFTAKGPIQESTLKPYGLADSNGSVFLLDATAFLGGDLIGALPTFTTSFVTPDIVIALDADMVVGHQYIALLTTQIEGKAGVPIVPSPTTVLLRTRGELVDDFAKCAASPPTATSLVTSVKAPDACELEAGRQQFLVLLDNETVKSVTISADRPEGLTREMVAYIFGFEYTAQ